MTELNKLTKTELNQWLEDTTFNNIIYWRRDELQRILDGEKAIHVIPQSNQRSKLLRDGVLVSIYRRAGKSISVSPKAIRLMEDEP